MKHFTLYCLFALLGNTLQAQVVFTSGFEDWTANLPSDWFGSKSNIAQSGVTQVSADVHGGSFAVRLTKTGTGHQRFTTQVQTVVADQAYEIRFWARGEGQIRVGLFDGRATGSGYAPYNPTGFVTITGNTWQEVALNVTAVVDATNAEFILSVQNTVAPEHMVVDDVTITAITVAPPPVVTVQDIQTTAAPDGASPLVGQTVTTSGIVTAITTTPSNGYFIQNGSGSWSGIFVFNAPGTLAIGDNITITGVVAEFNGQTQLSGISDLEVNSTGNAMPNTPITTAEANTEPYESVLGTVSNATCTEVPGGANFGKWKADDGSGWVYVGKQIYTTTPDPTLGQIFRVTGIVLYSFGEFNLVPRNAGDVELVTGMAEFANTSVSIYPNPSSDRFVLELGEVEGRTEYMVRDMNGRQLINGIVTNVRTVIPAEGLANGAYILTLLDNNTVQSYRLVVKH